MTKEQDIERNQFAIISRISHIEGKLALMDDFLDERFKRVCDQLDTLSKGQEKIVEGYGGDIKCLLTFKNRVIGAVKITIILVSSILGILGLYVAIK